MYNFLVPIDFSHTAKNAAKFAIDMARDLNDVQVTLYHLLDPIAAGSDGTPLDIDLDDRIKVAEVALSNLATELGAPANTRTIAADGVFLIDDLAEFVQQEGIDMVFIGLTGASGIEHLLMGSNAIRMANEAVAPVMIIPPDAQYRGLKAVVFATDMKDVRISTPINQLKAFLRISKPALLVMHVDKNAQYAESASYLKEKADLEEMLDGFQPIFHFIPQDDFVEAADQFATAHQVDCVITVPRNHSFLEGLFAPHYTRKLAYHTHIPLLAIHE
ncbi:universal stress protein [Flavihumibacter petaseus]|nr:universal stress protein [Flavihumibacter petaseus]